MLLLYVVSVRRVIVVVSIVNVMVTRVILVHVGINVRFMTTFIVVMVSVS